MRILWCSNAPWTPTGYGNQTGLICRFLSQLGHEIAVAANYGLQGAKLDVMGAKVYPTGRDAFSNDIVLAYADDWKADVVISLYDAWALNFARMDNWDKARPWIAWLPVDHEKAPPPVLESLKYADGVVAYSRHGQNALKAAGIDAAYIPHGIDLGVFHEGDQAKAREMLGFPQGKFLFGMVAANTFYPSRKGIPQAMLAFSRVREAFRDVALYLHMVDNDVREGVNVRQIAESLGLVVGEDVLIASQYDLQIGYPVNAMVQIYRALDVLLNPSLGEGFGIPLLEAMACGTPAIATNCTSMVELVGGVGWLCEGEPWWSIQGAWQTMPRVALLTRLMLEAIGEKNDSDTWKKRQQRCTSRAMVYRAEEMAAAWDQYLRKRRWETAA